MGDGSFLPDRREPGGNPARVERRHPRVSLGGEGDGDVDGLLRARRLRRDRAPPPLRSAAARRRTLPSGEADHVILTASRAEAEKEANPGYRAFFANGFNVIRLLVLFGWEVCLEWSAAARAKRRDVRPRGHRGGIYPLMRGPLGARVGAPSLF